MNWSVWQILGIQFTVRLAKTQCQSPLNLVVPLLAVFVLLAFAPLGANAADWDSVREPIVRPNEETVRRWLYNQEIVLEKRNLWFDRTAKIEPSKIQSMKIEGGSVYYKLPPMASYAITTRSFEYPDGKGKMNKYVAVIEYEWSGGLTGGLTGIDRKFSKATITGP